jgi:dienelactone hydrolase
VFRAIGRALASAAAGLTAALLVAQGLMYTPHARASEPAYFGPRLVQEDVRIPAGDGRSIAATIIRPEGPGPYGAVVLNHGVPGAEAARKSVSWRDFSAVAPVFARRGYAVVIPIRRGFGATGGAMAEDAGPCSRPDYARAERNASEDVMAAYDYARALPYVDGNRMILAGQSAGGVVSLHTAGTRQPKGLVAVLGFASGRGGNPDIRPGVPCAVEPVAKIFESLGKQVQVPVLLNYSENDQYFNPETSRLWFNRFTGAGARAEYVLQKPFRKDGHFLFVDLVGVEYWLPTVEKFLAAQNVPFERLDMSDPLQRPLLAGRFPQPPSESCASLYRVFLEAPGPRAYAVSGDGHCGFSSGSRDARETAMRECAAISATPCGLYAVDSVLVWKDENGPAVAGLHTSKTATAGK